MKEKIKKHEIKKHQERIVFSVRIDLNRAYAYHMRADDRFARRMKINDYEIFIDRLVPGGVYYFDENERVNDVRAIRYEDIVETIKHVANGFLSECNKENAEWMEITNMKLLGIQQGSIDVTMSFLATLFEVAGGIKNIYDCVEIVGKMLSSHFEEELASKFGGRYFVANTTVLAPTRNGNGTSDIVACERVRYKRDAFFYYLLISNVVLLTTIGLLVYKAVSLMYW